MFVFFIKIPVYIVEGENEMRNEDVNGEHTETGSLISYRKRNKEL